MIQEPEPFQQPRFDAAVDLPVRAVAVRELIGDMNQYRQTETGVGASARSVMMCDGLDETSSAEPQRQGRDQPGIPHGHGAADQGGEEPGACGCRGGVQALDVS